MTTLASPEPEEKISRYRYNEEFQKRIVAMLICHEPCWPDAKELIRPEYFNNPIHADLVTIVQQFYEKYHRRPAWDELLEELDSFLNTSTRPKPKDIYLEEFFKIAEMSAADEDYSYVHDKVVAFGKYQAHKNAIVKSVDLLREERDYDGIEKAFQEAKAVGGGGTCGLKVADLAKVERKNVRWFWPDKIPHAKLSLIVGDPDMGKSWFTLYLAACVTTGEPLPGTFGRPTPQGHVVILSAEDDVEDTIVPRLEDCGGDKAFAHVIEGMKEGRMFNLTKDLGRLEDYIRKLENVRLVIIDPLSAYVGVGDKANSHKDSDVRGILSPVVKLAKDLDVTIIGVMHLNKGQDLGAVYRVSGSMAFVAQARAVWLMMKEWREGRDRTLRYFSPIKANLSAERESLVWRLDKKEGGRVAVQFVTDAPPPPTIQEQMAYNMPVKATKIKEAKEFLLTILRDGPVPAEEVFQAAAEADISQGTLRNAKAALGVVSEKARGERGPISWRLPTDDEKKDWAR